MSRSLGGVLQDAQPPVYAKNIPPSIGFPSRVPQERIDPEWRSRRDAAEDLARRSAPYKVLAGLGGHVKPKSDRHLKLKGKAELLLGVCRQAKRHDWPGIRASNTELAQLLDCCERTVIRCTKALCAAGVLVRVPQWEEGEWVLPVGDGRVKRYSRRRLANAWVWGPALKAVRLAVSVVSRVKAEVGKAVRKAVDKVTGRASKSDDNVSPQQSNSLESGPGRPPAASDPVSSADPWLALCPGLVSELGVVGGVGCADGRSNPPGGGGGSGGGGGGAPAGGGL